MKYGIEFHYTNKKKETVFYSSRERRDDIYLTKQKILNEVHPINRKIELMKKIAK